MSEPLTKEDLRQALENVVKDLLQHTDAKLDAAMAQVNARLDTVNARLDIMDTRFDGLEARLTKRIYDLETKLLRAFSDYNKIVPDSHGQAGGQYGQSRHV